MTSFLFVTSNHKDKTGILHELELNLIPEKQRPLGTGMECLDCRDDYFSLSHIGKCFMNLFNVLQPITANLLFFNQSGVKLKPVKTLIRRVFPRSVTVELLFGLKFRSVHYVVIVYCDWPDPKTLDLAPWLPPLVCFLWEILHLTITAFI